MGIFELHNSKNKKKVEELRKKRNLLQKEIDSIQKEIDDTFIEEMCPPFKKGDYIRICLKDESRCEYMLIAKEPFRLVNGVKVDGPSVVVWFDEDGVYSDVSYYRDSSNQISTENFRKIDIISQDEFNKITEVAFNRVRADIAQIKKSL